MRVPAFFLLALPLALTSAPTLDNFDQPLECGTLSPAANACVDCCLRLDAATANASAGELGFVGQVDIYLNGTAGQLVWSCASLFVDAVPETPASPQVNVTRNCAGPWTDGAGILPGENLVLRCFARPVNFLGLGVGLGPSGPWGCRVWP